MTEEHLSEDLVRRITLRRPEVVVVGDAILDAWLFGDCNRFCREAPAPVLDVSGQRVAAGGAANTAVNLAGLGARVRLVTAVGDDADGQALREALVESGVDTEDVASVPGRTTMTKRRLMAGNQLLVRVDDGDQGPIPEPIAHRLRGRLAHAVQSADAVVVCDYGLGLFDDAMVAALRAMRPALAVFAVDAHQLGRFAGLTPDFVTPNLAETTTLLGTELPSEPDALLAVLREHQPLLHERTGAHQVVVTMDRLGAVLLREDLPEHRTFTDPVPNNRTAGAGDTFMAATCLARAAGLPMTTAVELGQAAADVVVHEDGTGVCTDRRLIARLARLRDVVLPADQLTARVATLRENGQRVVFTNGCFDLLHPGHIACLNQAKRLGDVLVVAVNSDEGVRMVKGPDRPVNSAADRTSVLAALSCVDLVTVFEGADATELVRVLRPDIYVKGGDHALADIPEATAVRAYGGEVRLVDPLPERSSSAVIERIRATAS